MSRVFDALQKTGGPADPSLAASPAAFVDALEKSFRIESLASVRANLDPDSRIVFQNGMKGHGAERYRLLRLRLQAVRAEANIKTLLITSPGAREGKSTVAINLAAALAEKKNQTVLVLEGDLRRPTLSRELGLKLPSGLTQCTRSDAGIQSAIWRVEPFGFYLLPAGRSLEDPTELLTSEWLSEVMAKVAESFDWIIIDAPPALPVVDALSLKRRADATILVAKAGHTQQSAIAEAIHVMGQDHVLGVILNGVEKLDRNYYGYYQ